MQLKIWHSRFYYYYYSALLPFSCEPSRPIWFPRVSHSSVFNLPLRERWKWSESLWRPCTVRSEEHSFRFFHGSWRQAGDGRQRAVQHLPNQKLKMELKMVDVRERIKKLISPYPVGGVSTNGWVRRDRLLLKREYLFIFSLFSVVLWFSFLLMLLFVL